MTTLRYEDIVKIVQSEVPSLSEIKNITKLNGGLTNVNFRIDTSQESYVVRVSEPSSTTLGINRDNEYINSKRAHEAGLGAEVIHRIIEKNMLIIKWIDAKTLHPDDIINQPSLMPRITNALKLLHAGPSFQGEFNFPVMRKKYLEIVTRSGYFIPDQYLELLPLIENLEQAIACTPEEKVPCNNDLLAENLMDDGNKIWIIDYEYAGQNEASFEIGNFAHEVELSDKQLTELCAAYWGQNDTYKFARAKAWSIVARYGWVLWASIQDANSSIFFDFKTWGLKKWDSVLPEIQGKVYTEILKNLNKFNA
jgi:thiamine kinase-like enzyme